MKEENPQLRDSKLLEAKLSLGEDNADDVITEENDNGLAAGIYVKAKITGSSSSPWKTTSNALLAGKLPKHMSKRLSFSSTQQQSFDQPDNR